MRRGQEIESEILINTAHTWSPDQLHKKEHLRGARERDIYGSILRPRLTWVVQQRDMECDTRPMSLFYAKWKIYRRGMILQWTFKKTQKTTIDLLKNCRISKPVRATRESEARATFGVQKTRLVAWSMRYGVFQYRQSDQSYAQQMRRDMPGFEQNLHLAQLRKRSLYYIYLIYLYIYISIMT